MVRIDGRDNKELRRVEIHPGFLEFAEGSALVEMGKTRVICSASIDERVPRFLRGQGKGWITSEYGMLPRSTHSRISRDRSFRGGRTMEIQRLIGRSLRSICDLDHMGERTITLDCDVLQADGGTRAAAITGGYVALYQALLGLVRNGLLGGVPLRDEVAAISVGSVDGELLVDLCYQEDARASIDFNVVMSSAGEFIELQGTGEERPFRKDELEDLLGLASDAIQELILVQRAALRIL